MTRTRRRTTRVLSRDHTTFAVGFAYLGVNAELGGFWTVVFGNA
jgi:hypothetical protein